MFIKIRMNTKFLVIFADQLNYFRPEKYRTYVQANDNRIVSINIA